MVTVILGYNEIKKCKFGMLNNILSKNWKMEKFLRIIFYIGIHQSPYQKIIFVYFDHKSLCPTEHAFDKYPNLTSPEYASAVCSPFHRHLDKLLLDSVT